MYYYHLYGIINPDTLGARYVHFTTVHSELEAQAIVRNLTITTQQYWDIVIRETKYTPNPPKYLDQYDGSVLLEPIVN